MPNLSIIPARAVADSDLTDMQVRVLCAVGTFTNRLGGNVWASVNTLAKQCNLSSRSVQRALPALVDKGYLRRIERAGRTNLYEVVLQEGVTTMSQGGDTSVTGGVTAESPKRSTERYKSNEPQVPVALMDDIWQMYPPRDTPHQYIVARKAIGALLASGVTAGEIYNAARNYAAHVEKSGTEPRYVKSIHGFYADDYWRAYAIATVHGRTREEWARSGQDVGEFDRLANGAEPTVADVLWGNA